MLQEFHDSLEHTVKTDCRYRRVVATARQARAFHDQWQATTDPDFKTVKVDYGKLRIDIATRAIDKMHAWVSERSRGFTLETQGRFTAKRRPNHLAVDDFIPLPSFCQSLAYETSGPRDRAEKFGNAKMRTIAPDDWKPEDSVVYNQAGIFSPETKISIDPLKVPIPFHSHYLGSEYQEGPSPGDYDHIFHIKWLFAPKSGHNFLYSGVSEFHVRVPYEFEPISATAKDVRPEAGDQISTVINLESEEVLELDNLSRPLTIGRAGSSDIQLHGPRVSRAHATLYVDDDGRLVLEDLKSANGTLFRGKQISRVIITEPGEIQIGGSRLFINP